LSSRLNERTEKPHHNAERVGEEKKAEYLLAERPLAEKKRRTRKPS